MTDDERMTWKLLIGCVVGIAIICVLALVIP